MQQSLHSRQQRHKQGDPVALTERLERLCQGGRHCHRIPGTTEALDGGSCMVHRQVQRGQIRQLLLPISPLEISPLAL